MQQTHRKHAMKKLVPIGISDFKELKSGNYYYVDKTMLIKDIFESGKAVLVTRPRRFGKTLNLSMLHYYFTLESNNSDLFVDTQIWAHESYKNLQGQFPVIFITFRDITQTNYNDMLKKIAYTVSIEFERFFYILEGETLKTHEKEMFNRINSRHADLVDLASSLEFLVRMLHKFHKKKVIVLLDEYDVPLQTAYLHGFYDELIPVMRDLLTGIFKDQVMLEKGVITGNLTLAKAGIFSGLNNLDVYNVTHTRMADKFGFTTEEAYGLLDYYECKNIIEEIKNWYDGYTFGEVKGIFNPWSMLKCISENGVRYTYWVNTSHNSLLKKLIGSADEGTKSDLVNLLNGQSVQHTIRESIIFKDLDTQFDLIWSLLLFTGYLTYTSCHVRDGKKECTLIIPNNEIKYLYEELIRDIFTQILPGKGQELLSAIIRGDTATFTTLLQDFVLKSMSTFDVPSSDPERSYHLFVLGLLVMLSEDYEVSSNREGGLGRYDIALIPKVPGKVGIVIEFKKVWGENESLEVSAQKALDQIVEKKYAISLFSKNVSSVFAYGIAFKGKTLFVKSASLANN